MKPIKPKTLSMALRRDLELAADNDTGGYLSGRDARAILAALKHAEERIDALKRAGTACANVCHAAKQGRLLDDYDMQSAGDAQRAWDDAVRRLNEPAKRVSPRRRKA